MPASGRAIGFTGGIPDEVCAGPSLAACPKSSVNQIEPSALQYARDGVSADTETARGIAKDVQEILNTLNTVG